MFSFYVHLDKSPELRAIRFALEKSEGKDVVEFFQLIREMVTMIVAAGSNETTLDSLYIEPADLAQIFSAVFETKMVSKMHLLVALQNRCDAKGISAGDFAAILLVDFVKAREKDNAIKSRPKEPTNSIANNKALASTTGKFSLEFPKSEHDSPNKDFLGSPEKASPSRNQASKEATQTPQKRSEVLKEITSSNKKVEKATLM